MSTAAPFSLDPSLRSLSTAALLKRYNRLSPGERAALGFTRPATDAEVASAPQSTPGAAADFSGPVFSNPNGIKVSDDTDSGVEPTRLPSGVTLQYQNFTGKMPVNASNPAAAQILPGAMQTIQAKFDPSQSYTKDTAAPAKFDPNAGYEAAPVEKAPDYLKMPLGEFLDSDIPLTSHENATFSGVQSIGRAARDFGKGVADLFKGPQDATESAIVSAHPAGAAVLPLFRVIRGMGHTAKDSLQAVDAIKDINASPDPAGAYAKALQQMTADGAVQALTAAAGEGLIRGIPKAAAAVSDAASSAGDTVRAGVKAGNKVVQAIDPDVVGIVSPRSAHALKVAQRAGKVANKYATGAPESAPVYPGAAEPTATPEQLNPSLVSEARTLPGQNSPEVIRPPAQPIPARQGLQLTGEVEKPAEVAAPIAETAPEDAAVSGSSRGAGIPRTMSGESALRQVLTGQDNANLLKIAKSRGINVAQESQLKAGVADSKLINKIIDDYSDDELDGMRSQYLENTRMGKHNFGDIGPEAWKTMGLKTYFPDLKIPDAVLKRTQSAIETAGKPAAETAPVTAVTPVTKTAGDTLDIEGLLKKSVEQAQSKKVAAAKAQPTPAASAAPKAAEGVRTTIDPKTLSKRWGVDTESIADTDATLRGKTAAESQDYIDKLAKSYKGGRPPDPVIEVRDADNNIVSVDGRHRALAAAQAGIDRIPIIVRRLGVQP